MAAYRRVYDSRHLRADSQEPGSAPEAYARQLSLDYLLPFTVISIVVPPASERCLVCCVSVDVVQKESRK